MKSRFSLFMLIAVNFVLACSNPQNSNKEMSDTSVIYNQEQSSQVNGADTKIIQTDTTTTGTDQKQSSRVNVGKDTVGKNNAPNSKDSD